MPSSSRPLTRRALALGLAALGCALSAPAALAQSGFPAKPITFVVPYPAGGANDMLGRLIGQKMGEALGATVIVDNKPGAGAMLGANAVAKAAPDGHTVLVGGLATHAASPHLMKADYDPLKDFEAVGLLGQAPIIVITSNESPYRSLKDVAETAKKKPGEMMYGSSGNGSPLHLAGELFDSINGSQMTHVPYKGGNAHIIDLVGGRVPVIFDTATNSMPLIRSGKVRPLAVSMPQRLPDLPNVPTFAESGFPSFQFTAWYGLFVPARTPKDVVARLSGALQTALKQPEVVEKLRGVGVSPAGGEAAELARLVPQEHERIGRLIKQANIKAD
ncbi:MAG: tripartite tricarboxylate transporter substrate binding protein [Sphaerotilus natans subsp. sulfidivorans]|uniref:Bug family tripartite tricarboxylate transporter substrate binding protein n=1 Tax=Sphaerotilus sulfidivorans TaxID=639200 RepID=UPI002356BDFA|nr:tripartite tricarboxylate transporter substrate binding protein [Sphaerotilus sulfidivorans]MCK6403917.1 tripartite tricarboxylate transporter substrate binding protein [Sphaerotilus sulfidivorans]